MSDDLGTMVVSFAADTAGLVTGATQAEAQLNSVEQAAITMAAKFSSIPTYNVGESITNTDVAEAKLTLLESKVNEAREKLQSLQDAADAGQAVTGIPEATAKLVLLENEAQRARESLQGFSGEIGQSFGGASEEAQRSFPNIIGNFQNFTNQIGLTIFNLQNLYNVASGVGQQLYNTFIAPNASMEQTTVGFETLLGKGKATQDFLGKLQNFAAATPFEFPQLATAAQHMIAFGFSANDVIPALTDIGDAMGALGKGPAEIDQVINVFGQMRAAGKVNAQDMMQLTSQGIPAWKFLADAMHMTIPEVQSLSQKGLLPANDAIKALEAGMHGMFGGGMAAQANTFNGLLSTLQDNAGAAMRAFSGPIFDMAKQGLTQLGNLVSSKSFQNFATTMGTQVGNALKNLGPSLQNIGNFLATNLLPPLEHLGTAVEPIITWAAKNDILGKSLTAVGVAMAGIVIGAGKLIDLVASITAFFTQNQVAGDIFIAVLVGIGAAILGIALTAIPPLLTAFAIWAPMAIMVGIANVIAFFPIIAIVVGIAAVVALVILAIQHWGAISAWFGGVWKAIVSGVEYAWNATVHGIQVGIDAINTALQAAGKWLYNVFVKPFQDAWTTISGIFGNIGAGISALASGNIPGALHDFGVPGFASGGTTPYSGAFMVGENGPELALLPGGTQIIPNSAFRSGSSSPAVTASGGGTTHIHNHLYIDGHELASVMLNPLGEAMAGKIRTYGPVSGAAA